MFWTSKGLIFLWNNFQFEVDRSGVQAEILERGGKVKWCETFFCPACSPEGKEKTGSFQ